MAEVTEAANLQSRFDQIGSQIGEAHETLDRICPDGEEQDKHHGTATPAIEGAEPGAERCQRELTRLLGRLANVATRVGHL